MDKVKAKYPDAKIVLAEMMAAPNMGVDYANGFISLYKELATSEDVILMPFFLKDVAPYPELLLADGKHPNANGQKIVARYIWSFLQKNVL